MSCNSPIFIGLSIAHRKDDAIVSCITWALRTATSNAVSGSSEQVRLPQTRKPSSRIRVVISLLLRTFASQFLSSKSKLRAYCSPVTPLIRPLEMDLCQPICWSSLARRPRMRAMVAALTSVYRRRRYPRRRLCQLCLRQRHPRKKRPHAGRTRQSAGFRARSFR
nr:MAG TPA: hypothetical protein [Caudoviricetes sp.]